MTRGNVKNKREGEGVAISASERTDGWDGVMLRSIKREEREGLRVGGVGVRVMERGIEDIKRTIRSTKGDTMNRPSCSHCRCCRCCCIVQPYPQPTRLDTLRHFCAQMRHNSHEKRWFYPLVPPGAVVVDYGCADGSVTETLQRDVIGYDSDPDMVTLAIQRSSCGFTPKEQGRRVKRIYVNSMSTLYRSIDHHAANGELRVLVLSSVLHEMNDRQLGNLKQFIRDMRFHHVFIRDMGNNYSQILRDRLNHQMHRLLDDEKMPEEKDQHYYGRSLTATLARITPADYRLKMVNQHTPGWFEDKIPMLTTTSFLTTHYTAHLIRR